MFLESLCQSDYVQYNSMLWPTLLDVSAIAFKTIFTSYDSHKNYQ